MRRTTVVERGVWFLAFFVTPALPAALRAADPPPVPLRPHAPEDVGQVVALAGEPDVERLTDTCARTAEECFGDAADACPVWDCDGSAVERRLCELGVILDGHIDDAMPVVRACQGSFPATGVLEELFLRPRGSVFTDEIGRVLELPAPCSSTRGDCDEPLVTQATFLWDPSGFNIDCSVIWFEPDHDAGDGQDTSFMYISWDISEGTLPEVGQLIRAGIFPGPFDADGNGLACNSVLGTFGTVSVPDDRPEEYVVDITACADLSTFSPTDAILRQTRPQIEIALFQGTSTAETQLGCRILNPKSQGNIPDEERVCRERLAWYPSLRDYPEVATVDACIQRQYETCSRQGRCPSTGEPCRLFCQNRVDIACRKDDDCYFDNPADPDNPIFHGPCVDALDCSGESCAAADANNVELVIKAVETSGLLGPHLGRVCEGTDLACTTTKDCESVPGRPSCIWCDPGFFCANTTKRCRAELGNADCAGLPGDPACVSATPTCHIAPDSAKATANRLQLSALVARLSADTQADRSLGNEEDALTAQGKLIPGLEISKRVRCVDKVDPACDLPFAEREEAPIGEMLEFEIVLRNTGSADLQVGLRDVLAEVLPQGALADCDVDCGFGLEATLVREGDIAIVLSELSDLELADLGFSAAFFNACQTPGSFLRGVQNNAPVPLGILQGAKLLPRGFCLQMPERRCTRHEDCPIGVDEFDTCLPDCGLVEGDKLTLKFRIKLGADEGFCDYWQDPDCTNSIHAGGEIRFVLTGSSSNLTSCDSDAPCVGEGKICSAALGVCVSPCNPQGGCAEPGQKCSTKLEARAICVDALDEAGVDDTREEQEATCLDEQGERTLCDDNVVEIDLLCREVDLTKSVEFTGQPSSRGKQLGVPGIEGPDCEGAPASCFVAHASATGCADLTCRTAVCAARESCCAVSWDEQCAELALGSQACLRCHNGRQECAEDPPDPSCRDYCVRSDAPGCPNDACAARVCQDCPECCELAWTQDCVELARDLEECACDGAVVINCCEAAEPGSGRTGCSDPTCEELVCGFDPVCCEVEWDEVCADEAQQLFGDICCPAGAASSFGVGQRAPRNVAGFAGCAGQANPLRLTFDFEVKNCGEVEEKVVIDDDKLCADLKETRDRYPDGIVFDCPICADPKESYYLRSKPSDMRCLNGAPCVVDADCTGANAKCLRRPRDPLPAERQTCEASCTVEFRAQNVLDYFLQLDDCDASCCVRDQQSKCSCDACDGDQGCPSGPVPSEEPQGNDCYVNCATASTRSEYCDKVCSHDQAIKCTSNADCAGGGVCEAPASCTASGCEQACCKPVIEDSDWTQICKCPLEVTKQVRCVADCNYSIAAPESDWLDKVCSLNQIVKCTSDSDCNGAGICDWPEFVEGSCLEYRVIVKNISGGNICRLEFADSLEAGKCRGNASKSCRRDSECGANGECLYAFEAPGPGQCELAPFASCQSDANCPAAPPGMTNRCLHVKPGEGRCKNNQAVNCDSNADCPGAGNRCLQVVTSRDGGAGLDTACQSAFYGVAPPNSYNWDGRPHVCDLAAPLGPDQSLIVKYGAKLRTFDRATDECGVEEAGKWPSDVPRDNENVVTVQGAQGSVGPTCPSDYTCRGSADQTIGVRDCDFTVKKDVTCLGPNGDLETATNWLTEYVEALPGDWVGFRVQVKNTGTVPLQAVKLDDVLSAGCTNWTYQEGSIRILNSGGGFLRNAKPCTCTLRANPACPAGSCPTLACLNETKDLSTCGGLQPGEILEVRFKLLVPQNYSQTGIVQDCKNTMAVSSGEFYECAKPCPECSDSAYVDVKVPDLECEKSVCRLGDAGSTCVQGPSSALSLPCDAKFPLRLQYRVRLSNGGEVNLPDARACDAQLIGDALATAASGVVIESCDLATVAGPDRPVGCSIRQALPAGGPPRDITCTIKFNNRTAWDAFAGRDDNITNRDPDEDCYKNIATTTGTATVTGGCNRALTYDCDATVCLPECLLEVNKYARCIPKLANGACNTGASEVEYPWKRDEVCSATQVPCGAGQPCAANTCSNGKCSIDGKDCSGALPCAQIYNECVAFEALPGDCVEFKIEVKNTSDDDAICALKIRDLMTNAGIFVASDPSDVRCWRSPPGGPAVVAACPAPFKWNDVESVVRLSPALVPTWTYLIRFWSRVDNELEVSSPDIARNRVTVTGAPDNGRGQCPGATEPLCYSEDCKDESSVAIDADRCEFSVSKHARCVDGPLDSWKTGGACPSSGLQTPALEVLPEGQIEYRIRACNDGETVIDNWRITENWGCTPRQDYKAGSLKAYVALKSADAVPLVAIPESAVCPSLTDGTPGVCAHPGEIDQPNNLVQSVQPNHCIVITFETQAKSNAPKCDDPPGVNCKDPEGGCCSNGVTVEAKASGCADEDRACGSESKTSSVHVKTIVPHIECEHEVCALLDSDDTCDVGPAPGIIAQDVKAAFRMRFFYTAKADLTDFANKVDKFTDVVISDPRLDCREGRCKNNNTDKCVVDADCPGLGNQCLPAMGPPGEFCPYKDLSPGACDFSFDGTIQVGDVESLDPVQYKCTLKFASVAQWKGLAGADSCIQDESRVCGKPHLMDVKVCPSEWRSVKCCKASACVTDVCCEKCPPVTKAKFEIFNENEVKLSGLERCIPEWDSTWLSEYTRDLSIANFFTIGRLGTNKGMARIEGMRSPLVCGDESIDTPLVGVATKVLMFEGADGGVDDCDGQRERATMSLVGTGTQAGWFKYPTRAGGDGDNPEDPGPELAVAATDAPGAGRAEGSARGDRTRPMDKDVRDALEAAARIASTDGRPRMEGVSTLGSKGSLLVFPLVEAKSRGSELSGTLAVQDTLISFYNDYPMTVHVQAYLVSALVKVDCEYRDSPLPDCPVADIAFDLTKNESKVWSALRGFEDGSFSVSTIGKPCPDDGPCASGAGVFRGYLVVWAVNDKLEEVHWNHLAGSAVLVNYEEGAAWEYGAWPFRSVVSGVTTGHVLLPPLGQLDLDGNEYEAAPDTLLLDFYATGTNAFGIPGMAVGLDTELTLVSLKRVFELPRQ